MDTLEPPLCSLDDTQLVTVGNAPLMGFLMQLMQININATEQIRRDFFSAVIEVIMNTHNGLKFSVARAHVLEAPFVTRSVHDIVWGYEDSILYDVDRLITLIDDIARLLGLDINVPLEPSFIGLQSNFSAPIRTKYSAINTGQVTTMVFMLIIQDSWEDAFSYEEWAGSEGALPTWKGCDNTTVGNYLRHAVHLIRHEF